MLFNHEIVTQLLSSLSVINVLLYSAILFLSIIKHHQARSIGRQIAIIEIMYTAL